MEMFQRSGLSKFAAATVRLAESQHKNDHILSSSSGNVKNDTSFMNHGGQPGAFNMDPSDHSYRSPPDEEVLKRMGAKPEPQDERH